MGVPFKVPGMKLVLLRLSQIAPYPLCYFSGPPNFVLCLSGRSCTSVSVSTSFLATSNSLLHLCLSLQGEPGLKGDPGEKSQWVSIGPQPFPALATQETLFSPAGPGRGWPPNPHHAWSHARHLHASLSFPLLTPPPPEISTFCLFIC